MIKGCQKRIIHLKNTGSPYFEEAYFILKDGTDTLPRENDMVKEALRIAESTSLQQRSGRASFFRKAVPALMGAASASLVFGIVLLIIAL
ncbi:MAG: hypothetical protein E7647_04130 [Ruminococcaceae bacterium]|nr:hypothetical protein [Oscillospiraceae bacterium]